MKIMITGASSGIGESLARRCAFRSFDLVLIARRKEKLEKIADELKKSYGISVETIQADLTISRDLDEVSKRLSDGDIDVLVNNAGFGSSGYFVEMDLENEINEIDLNVKALVSLSHVAGNTMKEKHMGSIINIGSIASYQPMPHNAVYAATKAFVTSFTHALREELRPEGINVMLVCPGPTKTEFFTRSRWGKPLNEDPLPEVIWQSADEVADAILAGLDHHKGVVIPGPINKALAGISSSLPSSVTRKVAAYVAKVRRTR